MAGVTRRACYKCGNVGHYAGMLAHLDCLGVGMLKLLSRGLLILRETML